MKNRGFTLIELLVMIAIIGILAAILLPALARADVALQSLSQSCKNCHDGYRNSLVFAE